MAFKIPLIYDGARPFFGNETTLKADLFQNLEKAAFSKALSPNKGFGARSLGTFSYNVDKRLSSDEDFCKITKGSDSITIANQDEIRLNLIEDVNNYLYIAPAKKNKPAHEPKRFHKVVTETVPMAFSSNGICISVGKLNSPSAVRYFSSLSVLSYLMPERLSCREVIELITSAGRKDVKTLKGIFSSAQGLALGRFNSISEYHNSCQRTGYAYLQRGYSSKLVIPANLLPFKGFVKRCLKDPDDIQYVVSVFRCAEVITSTLDTSTKSIEDPYNGSLTGNDFKDFINDFRSEANSFLEEYIALPKVQTLISESNLFIGYINGKTCPSGEGATKCFKSEFLSLRNYKDLNFYYALIDHFLIGRSMSDLGRYLNVLYNLELEFNSNIDSGSYSLDNFTNDILKRNLPDFDCECISNASDNKTSLKVDFNPKQSCRIISKRGKYFKYVPFLGDLLFLDKGFGGTRTVARANTFIQAGLIGGERVLSELLKSIPQDYTHKQDSLKDNLVRHVREFGSMPYSSDATQWTDRLPSELNEIIFKVIFGETLGHSYYRLLKDVEYCTNRKQVIEHQVEPEFVSYKTGQGMGLLTSWASSALVHHVLARLALKRAGFEYISRASYSILGDDMNISSRAFKAYQKIISDIGVQFSSAKCTFSKFYCEVAKRLFILKTYNRKYCERPTIREVTGFPVKELYRLFDNPIERGLELFNRLSRRDIDIFYPFNGLIHFLYNSKYGGCKSISTSSTLKSSTTFADLIGSYVLVSRVSEGKALTKGDKTLVRFTYSYQRFNLIDIISKFVEGGVQLALSKYLKLYPFLHETKLGNTRVDQNPFTGHAYKHHTSKVLVNLSTCLDKIIGPYRLTDLDMTFCGYFLKEYHEQLYEYFPDELILGSHGFNPCLYDKFLENDSTLGAVNSIFFKMGLFSTFKVINILFDCLYCFKQLTVIEEIVKLTSSVKDLDNLSKQKIRYKCDFDNRLELVKLISNNSSGGKNLMLDVPGLMSTLSTIIMSTIHLLESPIKLVD